jgi:hypothetical protein
MDALAAGPANTFSAPALITALLLLALSGCASAPRRDAGPIAVLRLDAVGKPALRVEPAARRAIRRQLRQQATLVDAARVEDTFATQNPCAGTKAARERCAVRRGERLGAPKVVAGALGGLGRTFVIQLDLIDTVRGAVTRSLEQTHYGSSDGLPRAVSELASRLIDAPRRGAGSARAPRPWYRRWWVWAIAGAVVAGSVTAAVLLSRSSDGPETVPLP